MTYESCRIVESAVAAGIRFRVARISFGRRIELARRLRDLAQRAEFLQAGDAPREKIEAALTGSEIDRIYVEWGLQGIEGLEIDGVRATPESLCAAGPENLFREALAAVKRECGLTDEERKN